MRGWIHLGVLVFGASVGPGQILDPMIAQCRLAPPAKDTSNLYEDKREAALFGQRLFFDPRLSGNSSESCAICHVPAKGWGDGERTPSRFPAINRNTQTLFNAAYQRFYFWDGRADSLWSQALAPIEAPNEMDGHRFSAALLVAQDIELLRLYEDTFGRFPARISARAKQGVQSSGTQFLSKDFWRQLYRSLPRDEQAEVDRVFANIGKALAAFERLIVSSESRFDRYIDEVSTGSTGPYSLNSAEIIGLNIFSGRGGCLQCHSGPSFSNRQLADARVHGIGPSEPGLGRIIEPQNGETSTFTVQSIYSDDIHAVAKTERAPPVYFFRTPSLRNVAYTAPYMHDGRYDTLEALLSAYHGTSDGQSLSSTEVRQLSQFLLSLTDITLAANPSSGGLNQIAQRITALDSVHATSLSNSEETTK